MDNTVLYDLSYGMYAVGVKDGMRECGCIVNTVFQVSTIGPLIALSMNKDNYTCYACPVCGAKKEMFKLQ